MVRRAHAGALVLALAFEAALGIVDASLSTEVIFTSAFVLGPIALAIAGRPRYTAIVSVVAVALAVASGWWNDYAGSADHLIRIAIVALGSALATIAAHALGRAAGDREHMQVLAAVGRLSGTEDQALALDGITAALIPSAADAIWIDAPRRLLATQTLDHTLEHASAATLDQGQATTDPAARSAAIPLKSGSQTFGVLGLQGRDYDASDLAFFEVLAGRVALVLSNVRLLDELRSARTRLDGILGALAEAVTVHDDDNQTIYANEAAARLLGRKDPDDVTKAKPGELAGRFTITTEDGRPVELESCRAAGW